MILPEIYASILLENYLLIFENHSSDFQNKILSGMTFKISQNFLTGFFQKSFQGNSRTRKCSLLTSFQTLLVASSEMSRKVFFTESFMGCFRYYSKREYPKISLMIPSKKLQWIFQIFFLKLFWKILRLFFWKLSLKFFQKIQ